ncbi:hypothetical protein [Avibacterium sp. 21-594]|uniref:hypothetical protein n=1 Tax=Avibacterium sp. 21-594 TaxID=2911535 RepID=UPI002246B248|nr:hypothetical protein [Avibacterium sp. 21-594]MCW9715090.1 hypothetical protein [Avibacterium sp. 21-594]
MQLTDMKITAEYAEYLGDIRESYREEPLPCWIEYNSETQILSIKFEYEQEKNKPNTYVWFEGKVHTQTYPYTVELIPNKPDVTNKKIWLEISNEDEIWYFEGLIDSSYTEIIDGVLVEKVEQRAIYINQVDS